MRIITGRFKGRRLTGVKGGAIRPTSDRVKESVFNILGDQVMHADFLDLCAGTGNIGLEALSRGANSATFVDRDYRSMQSIKINLQKCDLNAKEPGVHLYKLDAQKGLHFLAKRRAKFNLIYLDPPYDASIHEACLMGIVTNELLRSSGEIIVEQRVKKKESCSIPTEVSGLRLKRQQQYGNTIISFYQSKALGNHCVT